MIIARHKGHAVTALGSLKKKPPFYCLACDSRVYLNTSKIGNPFFAHILTPDNCPNGYKKWRVQKNLPRVNIKK